MQNWTQHLFMWTTALVELLRVCESEMALDQGSRNIGIMAITSLCTPWPVPLLCACLKGSRWPRGRALLTKLFPTRWGFLELRLHEVNSFNPVFPIPFFSSLSFPKGAFSDFFKALFPSYPWNFNATDILCICLHSIYILCVYLFFFFKMFIWEAEL